MASAAGVRLALIALGHIQSRHGLEQSAQARRTHVCAVLLSQGEASSESVASAVPRPSPAGPGAVEGGWSEPRALCSPSLSSGRRRTSPNWSFRKGAAADKAVVAVSERPNDEGATMVPSRYFAMASRSAQRRDSAKRLRLAIAEAERDAGVRRRRRNGGILAIVAAVLVIAIAIASVGGGGAGTTAATGAPVVGAASSSTLLSGIPQHGLVLGSPAAPVRVVEFADLQCPYCDEFATRALPPLVARYVRTGEVSFEFRNLSFIGPDSVRAGLAAAGAEQQNKLWNFIDLMYLNQGQENTGYVTTAYLHRLLAAVPGLDVGRAERASQGPQAQAVLTAATIAARADRIDATPSFLIGRTGGPLRVFQPSSLTAGAFTGELDALIGARG